MSVVRSKKTVIPISRNRAEGAVVPATSEPPNIALMQHNMEQELERRRQLWEQDVARMSEDFFQLKPGEMKSITPANQTANEVVSPGSQREVEVDIMPRESIKERFPTRPPGMEILDIHNADRLYSELEDGRVVYRMRFDVRGFEPEDIHVRIDGKKLSVSAKHQDDTGSGTKSTREFKRQMDIPEDVLDDSVASHLSVDGILMVEGQVDPSRADVYKPKQYPEIEAFQRGEDTNGLPGAIIAADTQGLKFLSNSPTKYDRVNANTSHAVYGARGIQGMNDFMTMADNHTTKNGEHSHGCLSSNAFSPQMLSQNMGNMSIHDSTITPQHHRYVQKTRRQDFTPLASLDHHMPIANQESNGQERIVRTQERTIRTRDRSGLAPINPAVETNSGLSVLEPSLRSSRDVTQSAFRTVSPSHSRPTLGRFTSPLVVICEGQRKLKLCVYLGDCYDADSIVVRCKEGKIGVYASQQKQEPFLSKREFSREFDLPETIEVSTLSAVFRKDGQVTIAASILGNSNHQVVVDSIKQDIPPDAKPLRLEI